MRTTVLATASAMPKITPADQSQPNARATSAPSRVATALCATGARNRDPPDGEQFLDVELEADDEHEQDDADLGELLCQRGVRDEARGVRPHEPARQAGGDNRREA